MNPQTVDQMNAPGGRRASLPCAAPAPEATPPPLSGHHILGFSPDGWPHADAGAPLALLRRLARTNRVGYVDGASPDAPADQCYLSFTRRFGVVNRRGQPADSDAINDLPPWWPFLPMSQQRDGEDVPSLSFVAELCTYCDACRLRPTLIWTPDPAVYVLRPFFPHAKFIYHVIDDLHRRPYGRDRLAIQRRHRLALTSADYVLCSTDALATAVRPLRSDAVVVRSGLGLSSVPHIPLLPDFDDMVPPPAVLCAGPFSCHHDPTLVDACAAALPDVNFIVAGRNASCWLGEIAARPNIYVSDDCPFSQLPRFLCQVSACLLVPRARSWFALGEQRQLPFYLAFRLPVVSTAAPAVCMFDPGAVHIARSKTAYVALLRRALCSDTPAQRDRRRAAARRFEWARSLAQLAEILGPPPALSNQSTIATFARIYRQNYWISWNDTLAEGRDTVLQELFDHVETHMVIERSVEIDLRARAAARHAATAAQAAAAPPPAAAGAPPVAAGSTPTAQQPALQQVRFRAKPPGRSKLREEEERIAKAREEARRWIH